MAKTFLKWYNRDTLMKGLGLIKYIIFGSFSCINIISKGVSE